MRWPRTPDPCVVRRLGLARSGRQCRLARMDLRFEWDPVKAEMNARKHGITFTEASTAFSDPLSLTIPDPDHSEREERFLLLGRSSSGRLLVVTHTERGEAVRIISARAASRRERRDYEEDTR